MIFDFECAPTGLAAALWGGIATALVVVGLGLLGKLAMRQDAFEASDVFAGWGVSSAFMTLVSVFLPNALGAAAFGIFALMLWGAVSCFRTGSWGMPFWTILVLGIPVAAAVNGIGLGGFAFDDFSHWAPNALYVFQHNDVPSKALPAAHSLYPGYPYALPFLTYLASMLARGFLVQGGAMFNVFLLGIFGAMLVEYVSEKRKGAAVVRLAALAFVLGLFFVSTISTFGITNQGEAGTMALCGGISLLLMRLLDALRAKEQGKIKALSLRLGLVAMAFVLLKEANLVLLALLVFAFLFLAAKTGAFKRAARSLFVVILPAFALAVVWLVYAKLQIGGGGVGIQSPSHWRFDMIGPLFQGIKEEIGWKPLFAIAFLATACGAIGGLCRPRARWSEFMLYSLIVQTGYFAFLVAAFIGSDFTPYTIRLAASFHRYMLHAGFLALPAFWMVGDALSIARGFHLTREIEAGSAAAALSILPLVLMFQPDWIAAHPDRGMCKVRELARKATSVLPEYSKIGVFAPADPGMFGYIVDFELALAEAQTGKSYSLAWRADRFHTFVPATKNDVSTRLSAHPDTAAIIFDPNGARLLDAEDTADASGYGLLVRDGDASGGEH